MSANEDTFRRVIQAFNAEGPEAVIPFFSEDVEIYDPDLPESSYRGHEGLRRVLDHLAGGWASAQVRGFDLRPAGDRVVGLVHFHGSGPDRRLEVELRDAHTMTFRDGKIVYWRIYLDRDEALADAGLPREGESPRGEAS